MRFCLGLVFTLVSLPAFATTVTFSNTNFTGFTTGVSVAGQGGWAIGWRTPKQYIVDQSVVDDGTGNTVFRFSNAMGSSDLNDQPFAPTPAGVPTAADMTTDPSLGQPGLFAGESSTGAKYRRFYASFDFKSATGTAQPNLKISVSPDNGLGSRMGYVQIVDTGSGFNLVTYDVDAAGNFVGPTTIATGLSYTAWHKIGMEILFKDGPANDVVHLYLDGKLIHTGTTWEAYYAATSPTAYPLGVAVQTLVFNSSPTGTNPAVQGGGLYFDNVLVQVGTIPPVSVPMLSLWSQLLLMLGIMAIAGWVWRDHQQVRRY